MSKKILKCCGLAEYPAEGRHPTQPPFRVICGLYVGNLKVLGLAITTHVAAADTMLARRRLLEVMVMIGAVPAELIAQHL